MIDIVILLVVVALVVACGIFVAAEFSFITVNRATVKKRAAKGDKKAQGVSQALESLSTQLSGAQVGITITNLAIGFLAEPLVSAYIKPLLTNLNISEAAATGIAILIGTAIATAFTMVFGELIPKNIAIAKPLATARAVQHIQRGFSNFMRYPIRFLNNSANFLLRRIGVEPQEELASARSGEELTSLVRHSAAKGTLPKRTAAMLERTLVFDELTALDIMTPRIRMKTVKSSGIAQEILEIAQTTGFSRFAVIGKNLDDIVGMVHIKHALALPRQQRQVTKIYQIMQQPIVVPSSVRLDTLLGTLRRAGLQAAVVIDEFGGTDGIVTIEDLIEELVGEVRDEHDRSSDAIRKRSRGSWSVSGLVRPDEIGEELGIYLPDEDDFETLGGLMADRLERVPVRGDTVSVEAVDRLGIRHIALLTVMRMEGRRVDRIDMKLTKDESHTSGVVNGR